MLRAQATHMPCLQEVFAGRCHERVMTPSLDAVVSTATPESHGGKRIERVLTSLLLAPSCIRRPDSKRKCPISRAFYGRYWARSILLLGALLRSGTAPGPHRTAHISHIARTRRRPLPPSRSES